MKRRVGFVLPAALFAASLVFLQWISGMAVTALALKAVLVFFLATTLIRLVPWRRWLLTSPPNSTVYLVMLFGLFVRHFVGILRAEARRVLLARRLAVPRHFAPGWFRSLACAVTSIFTRSLNRAERFYAAQLLRGIVQ